MPAKTMTNEQRKALVVMAFQMMVADHEVAAPEQVLLKHLETEMHVEGHIAPAELVAAPDYRLFAGQAERAYVLGRLVAVALADGRRHINENETLRRAVSAFGFGRDDLDTVIAWAGHPAPDPEVLCTMLGIA